MIRFLRGLAPWLVAAEEWPVLGAGARWIRDTYLPPEPPEVADDGADGEDGEAGTEIIHLTPDGKRWDPDTPIDLRPQASQGEVQELSPPAPPPSIRQASSAADAAQQEPSETGSRLGPLAPRSPGPIS